jgi:hypothetical protein
MISAAAVIFLTAIFVAVLMFVIKRTRIPFTQTPRMERFEAQRYSACPLCGTKLVPGENIVSRIYTTESGQGKPCTIHGCPHCYPSLANPAIVRICPVCKKNVPTDGHLLSRIFYRNGQKQHVHVVGCSECHKR